jgi:hypothetical protein
MVSSDDAPVPLLSLPQYPDLQFNKAKIHALLVSWGIESSIHANSWTLGRTVCSILRSDDRIRSVVAMLDKEDEHTFFTTLDDIVSFWSEARKVFLTVVRWSLVNKDEYRPCQIASPT